MDYDLDYNNNFNPNIFIKIGQLLCSDEYIYYNGFFFQEDIDRYNQDEENKYALKKKILKDIHCYFNVKNNEELIKLKKEIEELKKEIEELTNKNNLLIKNKKINNFILDKYKIYEETIKKLIILKDEIEQHICLDSY